MRLWRLCLLAAFLPAASRAAPSLTVTGFVDVGYIFDSNAPPTGQITAFTAYPLDRAPQINLMSFAATFTWGGFHLRLQPGYGTGLDALHAPNPQLAPPWSGWRHLMEAYAGYVIPVGHGLTVDAGLFAGPLGYESYIAKDNANVTHSFVIENVPFYQVGVRISYPFTDNLTVRLWYFNGWNAIDQDQGFRSFSLQVAFTTKIFQSSLNTFFGPARFQPPPGGTGYYVPDYDHFRYFANLWAVLQPIESLKLAADLHGGFDARPDGTGYDTWYAFAVFVRYQFASWFAVALRGEVFNDRDGGIITGTPQLLDEATLTADWTWGPLLLRLEGRVDRSDAAYFEGNTSRELLVVSVVGQF
jgi:hypothetical protein